MDKIVGRHKNLSVLAAVLLLQIVLLAVQVKRPTDGGVSLIRVWTVGAITPFEKALVHASDWVGDGWRNYVYTRALRNENERLQDENIRLRMEQVRMIQDASQAERLQALLKFKQQYVADTVAAQVVGTSGSETSRLLYIDKGSNEGLEPDMAVITPAGVVGKVIRVFPATAQVLEINDQSSGIGAILEKSRLQGILKGTPSGETMLEYVMSDEKVEVGERVLTSGGDRIFPKGLPVGTVVKVNPGEDMFLNIRVKPSARLNGVEEVLVITKVDENQPEMMPDNPQRAADILAERLPSVPVKPPDVAPDGQGAAGAQAGQAGGAQNPAATGAAQKPNGQTVPEAKSGAASSTKPGAKPVKSSAEPDVSVNGRGVKHVSDLPDGTVAAKKAGQKPAPANTNSPPPR